MLNFMLRARFDVSAEWNDAIKKTVAHFARNVAARQGRILLPSEQREQSLRARAIAEGWRSRRSKKA